MKQGTLMCNLFGHKSVIWSTADEYGNMREGTRHLIRCSYCVRCGIDLEAKRKGV